MKNEPVLIGNAITAVVALAFAIASGHVTEGVVSAAALAVVSLIIRAQVTPNSKVPGP